MQEKLFNLETALITRRTVVRRFRENDGAAFYELCSANSSILESTFPPVIALLENPEASEFFIRRKLSEWLLQESYTFGIWDKESTKLTGYVSIDQIDWSTPKGRLRFFIDKDATGKGLMTEILISVISFAFRNIGLEKLSLDVHTENFSAQRLVRKCGFQREGDLRGEYKRPSGDFVDVTLFGLTKSTYEKI